MTILNRTLSVALGASIALTPVFAFAHDEDASSSAKMPFVNGILQRIENIREPQLHATTSVHVEMNGEHKGDMKHASTTAVARIEAHADAKIDNRVKALQKLSDRIDDAKRIPDGMKTSLTATLALQMKELADLKAKIGSDTSTTSMRDDAGKIRPEFRTYALILPKTAITAGSNRILATATQMDAIGVKLNARINEVSASSTVNVSSARTAYTDYLAKVADAKVQANAAAALVVNLVADNGDKTVFAANETALKAAAADLKAAQADLKAARADINTILKVIKGTGVRAHATSTVEVR
ncbi:MAG: hypothetical protein ABIT47_00630 [Candidatus Paceibacterota bacterium]